MEWFTDSNITLYDICPDEKSGKCDYSEPCDNFKRYNLLAAIKDILGSKYDLDRLKQLIEADREGRCVVLPVKIGDMMYEINNVFDGEKIIQKIENRSIDGFAGNILNPIWLISKKPYEKHYHLSEFGKTIFRTLGEAESALKAMKESENN